MANVDIYGGKDPRDIPAYTIPMAARHAHVPSGTLRSWVAGRSYETSRGARRTAPIIKVPDGRLQMLSFTNLIEAHVLASMRRVHGISMQRVRTAVRYVKGELGVERPLAREAFKTDGAHLFVERLGQLINVSSPSTQLEMRVMLERRLRRIVYEGGIAMQLFPLVRSDEQESPRLIVIDPRLAFGRPVLVGTGVPVDEVWQRFQAGESTRDLAEDFRLEQPMVEEAIRSARAAA